LVASTFAIGGYLLVSGPSTEAADHADSPAVAASESSDLADLYAFTNNMGTKTNLIMTFGRGASPTETFDTNVDYVFHLSTSNGQGGTSVDSTVTCNFAAGSPQQVTCTLEDGSTTTATASGDVDTDVCSEPGGGACDGDLRVYAGVFDDPFFFNAGGFSETVSTVVGVAGTLEFSEEGCPELDGDTAAALVDCLGTACDQFGGNSALASDTFAGGNVQAIALQLKNTSFNGGGSFLDFWGATVVGSAQVDRAGRPAISTALVGTFGGDSAAVGNLKDAYNADSDRSAWDYESDIKTSLGILDALNSTANSEQ